ncbi:MAG TPA: M36 family metallopeptidase [Blastocatellia bacterium]|nr:M36 family metallopeptidase [Blastocatellia bacterium]
MKRDNLWAVALIGVMLLGLALPLVGLRSAQAAQDLIAQDEELKSRVSNYDIRDDGSEKAHANKEKHRQKLTPAQREKKANLGQAMRNAKDRLAAQIPGLEVKLSSAGSAEIVGVEPGKKKFLTDPSSEGSEKVVKDFVGKNAALYGLTARQVAQLRKVADYTNPAGNLSWVELRQEIKGLPVFQGELRAALTRNGEVVRTVGRLAPVVEDGNSATSAQSFSAQSVDGAASAAEAVSRAAEAIGVSINANDLVLKESATDGTSYVFEPGPFADYVKVEAVYFPIESGLAVQAWSMILWQETPAYYSVVDADGGDLLWRKNITEEQTQPVTYSIYNDDSPAPLSPSNALPGQNVQAPFIGRTSVSLVSELPAFDNLGWITDGGTTTTGNNVDAGLDVVSPNGIDPGSRPVSATRNFTFAYDPTTDAPQSANYRLGAVTNLFFWSNRYHDRLYSLGFNEAARNFQQNNFGRGGLGNDFVRAEAQDFSGTNNANFSTGPDGSQPRMQMYVWPGPNPDRDGDLDQVIVLHELTHGTSNRLHNNASGLGTTVSRGMGEGWSDFYARSILSSADEDVNGIFNTGGYATFQAIAGYTDNNYYGIRRFPYAVKTNVGPNGKPHNPLTLADTNVNRIDLTDGAFPRGPFGAGGRAGAVAVHNIGEIWCMTLLEVRARMITRLGYEVGNQRMLQLVTDAMKLDPVNPTLIDGRNSLLAADSASFNGEDSLDIWAGFATRGMGFGATMSITNVNGKESFDNPIPGLSATSFTDAACNSNGRAEPGEDLTLTVPLTNPLGVALTNVSANVVGGGAANYGTINPGQTVAQNISFQVPASAVCGSAVTITVNVTSSLGQETKTFTIPTGQAVFSPFEGFDGVTAPALPAGWTSSVSGAGAPWTTSAVASDTAPNAASTTLAATTGTSQLLSPTINVPPTGKNQLSFRHSFNSEFEWDGGIVAISINGGSFFDVLDAGGSFETGGYTFALTSAADGNTNTTLRSRAAWTGDSGGFITSTINLPASAAGQSIRLLFIAGSDSAFTPVGAHWRIDSISLINSSVCATVATATSVTAATVQYSDQVTLSATVASSCANPTGSVQFSVNGNPVGGPVAVNGPGTVTLPATVTLAAGSYPIVASFTSSNPYYQNSSGSNTLTVTKENAVVTPAASSPTSVQVSSPGGTASSVTLVASVADINDGFPGNISNVASVTFTLSPIAAGPSYTLTVPVTGGGGVGGTVNASAPFTNVAVNVYEVAISVNGNYYTGGAGTILAVFDPSLGFVTGGGTINRNGVLANFGFNVKYQKNGQAQGSFLYIEHRPGGDVKLKGNSMQSLSIAGNTGIFLGKATLNGVGNYSFRATATDNGEPGSGDQFGLAVTSPNGSAVSDLTFSPVTLSGGNIQVPQGR